MPVYDIAAGQRMAKPVSSMLEGKAVRLALRNQEIQNQAAQMEVEDIPRQQQIRDEQHEVSMSEADRKRLQDFVQVAEPFLRKGDYEGARAISAQMKLPDMPRKAFDVLRESLPPQDRETAVVGGRLVDENTGEVIFEGEEGDATPSEVATFRAMTEGMTEEEIERARRIELGLSPRAVGNADITLASGAGGVSAGDVADAAGTVKAGEEAGKQAIQESGKAREQLAGVRKSISNIDDAIRVLDEGANSGAIASRLPSIQSASVELDNVRGQMGLDILHATTFGALSKGELDFALSTAMPTGLDEPELKKWLKRKREAQRKLADELEGAAIFLGTPGNTVAEYMQFLRDQGALEFEESEVEEPSPAGLSDDDLKKKLGL